MTRAEPLSKLLIRLDACEEARDWAKGKSLKTAWAKCERGDWMTWLLANPKAKRDDRLLRLLACDIVGTVLHLVPAGEDRPRIAIETARRFANGQATAQELAAARDAARAAEDAVWAAGAAEAAAGAAGAAGAAVRVAAWAAEDAVWAAGAAANMQHADLVRKWFPLPPEIKP